MALLPKAMCKEVKTIGLIINPIAGMGGKTALRGTDGSALQEALRRGAAAEAPQKALRALRELQKSTSLPFSVLTCGGEMGERCCQAAAVDYKIVYATGRSTTAAHTQAAAQALLEQGVDLLLFAGGDGTARDIAHIIGKTLPVIGIPAGVKIQSAVFAVTPEAAGRLAARAISVDTPAISLREVVDLDEELYRQHLVRAKLYGYLAVPQAGKGMQSMKVGQIGSDEGMLHGAASHILSQMRDDCYYAVGPGTTTKAILQQLGISSELLGVDILHQQKLIASDVTEETLFSFVQEKPIKIIVSPIGGQGFLFGRGNHQFSSRILQTLGKDNIIVMASQEKLIGLADGGLQTDCGDEKVDRMLAGYYQVVCGRKYSIVMPCNLASEVN